MRGKLRDRRKCSPFVAWQIRQGVQEKRPGFYNNVWSDKSMIIPSDKRFMKIITCKYTQSCITMNRNLVPRVPRLFGQQVVFGRDSGIMHLIFSRNLCRLFWSCKVTAHKKIRFTSIIPEFLRAPTRSLQSSRTLDLHVYEIEWTVANSSGCNKYHFC